MFEIKRYTAERKDEWDEFVRRSKQGTFLLCRDYMDYHSDRFDDMSLMIYRENRLQALLPANIKDSVLHSHQGLTYGGLVTDGGAKAADTCLLFEELNAWLKARDIKKVAYKPAPWIYFARPAEEDLYALTKVCRAGIVARDISSTIFLDEETRFSELRRRGARKAERLGCTVSESHDIAAFWHILNANLTDKYGVAPVHTCEELQLLMSRFPDNIRLYLVSLGDKPLGGTLVYINRDTVHTQYISASPEGKRSGALDLLFTELICHIFRGFKYFDFGKSTERGGSFLNDKLIFQKEGFGARGVCYDTYEWDV